MRPSLSLVCELRINLLLFRSLYRSDTCITCACNSPETGRGGHVHIRNCTPKISSKAHSLSLPLFSHKCRWDNRAKNGEEQHTDWNRNIPREARGPDTNPPHSFSLEIVTYSASITGPSCCREKGRVCCLGRNISASRPGAIVLSARRHTGGITLLYTSQVIILAIRSDRGQTYD